MTPSSVSSELTLTTICSAKFCSQVSWLSSNRSLESFVKVLISHIASLTSPAEELKRLKATPHSTSTFPRHTRAHIYYQPQRSGEANTASLRSGSVIFRECTRL